MSAELASVPPDLEADRRLRVLAAAERAFAKHGFHGSSMQHVAAEAGMSAGNLYRYFPSKEAIVSGLTEHDRAALASDFAAMADRPDFLLALRDLLRKHLVEEPIWKVRLIVEIWAEAGRNPAVATLCSGMDDEIGETLVHLIADAQARGAAPRGGDPVFVIRVMKTLVDGLFKRRATEADFDGDDEIRMALGIARGALDGSLRPLASENVR